MKYIKYIGIILTVFGMLYAKLKIDARNRADIQTIDSLDQDDGTAPPASKIKKTE